jgi:hypothetical protein
VFGTTPHSSRSKKTNYAPIFLAKLASSNFSIADVLKKDGACPNSMVFVEYFRGCSTNSKFLEFGEIPHHCHW